MRSVLYAFLFFLNVVTTSFAAVTGSVVGVVTGEDGAALAYANVVVKDTSLGAMSQNDGSFAISFVPPGEHTVIVSILGYQARSIAIVVDAGGKFDLGSIKLLSTSVQTLDQLEIVARKVALVKTGEKKHVIDPDQLTNLPVQEAVDVIKLKPGVIANPNGGFNVRGGRTGEVTTQINGVTVDDPLRGTTASLATRGIENVELITGGMTAEYGDNQSGVVLYRTKEGGDSYEGEFFYQTDDYGSPQNTFDNLDRLFLGFGGPLVKHVTVYGALEATFSDGYPKADTHHQRHKILNLISLGDRNYNKYRGQLKFALQPNVNQKITAEVNSERSTSNPFYLIWSRKGFVRVFNDTTATGEVRVRHGHWSPTQIDESYLPYNPADHTPTEKRNFSMHAVTWRWTMGQRSYMNTSLARTAFVNDSRVKGKESWEYAGNSLQDYWFNYETRRTEPFFVTSGDFPRLQTQDTKVYSARVDFSQSHPRMLAKSDGVRIEDENGDGHNWKAGIAVNYDDNRYLEVINPFQTGLDGTIGTRTRYHYYSPDGSGYVQDQWKREGMIITAGVRYDLLSVGKQLPLDVVRHPLKTQISPRVGFAYPISDKDVFSFHYGRFTQWPKRQNIFADYTAVDGRVRGNPNLAQESTSSYQASVEHLFNELVKGSLAVYYKDVFGLISTENRVAFGTVGALPSYVNRDYASSRGFELTLSKKFSDGFATEINYSFGVATGTASDPNAQQEQTFIYLPISEQPLDWDRRHSISWTGTTSSKELGMVSWVWTYSSGVPYTPFARGTREVAPESVNSRRLPAVSNLDIQLRKEYSMWSKKFSISVEAENLLDSKNIAVLAPDNFPAPPSGGADEYVTYYSETGRAGGAYLGDDRNGDGIGDWVPLSDPRVFGPPRSVRMGISFGF